MTYITVKQKHEPKQVEWEDVLFDIATVDDFEERPYDHTGTITRKYEKIDDSYLKKINLETMIGKLEKFCLLNEKLFEQDRDSLYRHFTIPKKTGGLRPIDAPVDELQTQLGILSEILTNDFGLKYHTSAFAYIKDRSTVDCVRRHKLNESNWFLKTDFSGFFPNTNLDFTMKMLGMIFPTSEICKDKSGEAALRKALSLGFLHDSLPQGTRLSPTLTNIIMIPIDHALFNALARRKIIYTRYADDMFISAKEKFPYREIVQLIRDTLKEFGAPYLLKDEKTHFGSRKGHNFCLGLCLNADNNITTGYKTKKYFKAAMTNFILDTKNEKSWPIEDVMTLRGKMSYYKMIEPQYFDEIVTRMSTKWNVDVLQMFKKYLSL